MTQRELVTRLEALRPGSQWAITGAFDHALYTDLVWLDATPAPTAQELGL